MILSGRTILFVPSTPLWRRSTWLGLASMGLNQAGTGRPAYHPAVLLKLYIYGYVNRVPSSRRLEREACRNLEVMCLLGRLVPDDKVIADFRKDNGAAIRKVCGQFVELCRKLGLLTKASVAIDGSKFKAVNDRDKNFTRNKMDRRRKQLEESVARYLGQLDTADRQEPSEALSTKTPAKTAVYDGQGTPHSQVGARTCA
jgi:transposase